MYPSMMHILVVVLLVLVLFGSGRVPGIMENLAKGINSFKKGLKDEDDETASKRLKDSTGGKDE
jgi:sec-independent protein translocase protein TatA